MQKKKCYTTNTFVRATKKKIIKCYKNIQFYQKSITQALYIKVTKKYKIVTFIYNIINIRKLQTEPTKYTIKFWVNIYSYNKHLLLGALKLLRDKRNMPIFLFSIGKI